MTLVVLAGAAIALAALPPLWLLMQLRRYSAGRSWWIAAAVVGLVGLAFGVWCGFVVRYEIDGALTLHGVPFPSAIDRPVDSVWRKEEIAPPWFTGTIDILLITGLAHAPVAMFAFICRSWFPVLWSRGPRACH